VLNPVAQRIVSKSSARPSVKWTVLPSIRSIPGTTFMRPCWIQ
jgi:hypothetical protein